ncbi:hypothetical protein [Phytohabitans aurantiacus]|uniref:Uncharacterized protein n=1 Tax=Phytohabitans aurantiacus TaxID=3016789 RepID=A0ABQ5QL75_9ACTN|nr:hypothetical protein [Phytohabitans aurantiacus]GLH94922.1 hypothetical protein Pa4123_01940 [Phytohabitans aurantiacus]
MVDVQTLLAVPAAALIGANVTGWAVLVVVRRRRRAQLVDVGGYAGRHRPPGAAADDAFRLAELARPAAHSQRATPVHRYAWPATGRG